MKEMSIHGKSIGKPIFVATKKEKAEETAKGLNALEKTYYYIEPVPTI